MRDSHRSIVRTIAHMPMRTITCATLAVALSTTSVLFPVTAYAVSEETQAELDSASQQVVDSAAAYNEAVDALDELQEKIDENNAAIEELEESLPEKQEAASAAMRDLYKYQQGSNPLVELVVGSDSLNEFLTTCVYMSQIQSSNTEAIEELNAAQEELEERKAELEAQKKQLQEDQQAAADALAEAQKLRQQAQEEAEAEAAAELAALAAQAEAEEEESEDTEVATEETTTTESSGSSENPYNTATDTNQTADVTVDSSVNWSSGSRQDFIDTWASRINSYLSGSPLAGYGETFSAAAWDYGVDPRWSPAIACIESSKGRYCAGTCNAWGWTASGGGFRSFSSWEEGIYAHVSYLRSMYGTTLTPEAAKIYCPPTWQDWYNKVGSEMNKI